MKIYWLITVGLILPASALAEAEADADGQWYVQTDRAAVFDEPSFGDDPVARLAQGLPVESLEQQDGWHRIQVEEVSGWMPGMVLRESPPTQRQSQIDDQAELDASSRRRASAVTTAGAIRGVEEDERLLDDPNLDIEALRRMEELGASPEDAMQFMLDTDEDDH